MTRNSTVDQGHCVKVRIEITRGPACGQAFEFCEPDRLVFGRALDARISLPDDPYVSRHHFLLEIAPPHCRVSDLASENGVFVNQVRYGGRTPLPPGAASARDRAASTMLVDGDVITVGETELRVSVAGSGPCAEREGRVPSQRLENMLREAIGKRKQDPRFHGYRVIEVLGRGGMGLVYKAEHVSTGRTVAIKTLRPEIAVVPDAARRFLREASLTQQLKHPNLVQLLESGEENEEFHFVLEFVDGMDLGRLLQREKPGIGLRRAARLMLAILDGMAYAHRARLGVEVQRQDRSVVFGLVHRDLKPQNILIDTSKGEWVPKVADFGLAKGFEAAGMTDMTMGGVAGTATYWPREQLTHYRWLTPASDVFSLGAIFVEMLTGRRARRGFEEIVAAYNRSGRPLRAADVARAIFSNPIPPLREARPEIPPSVADVLDQSVREAEVSGDPAVMREQIGRLRFPDAFAFRQALAGALEREGLLGQNEADR